VSLSPAISARRAPVSSSSMISAVSRRASKLVPAQAANSRLSPSAGTTGTGLAGTIGGFIAPLRRPLLQDPRPPTTASPVDRPADPAGGPGARLHQPDLADKADDRRRGDQAAHLDYLRGAVLAAERQATEASRRLWDRAGVDEA
jgi:hypothetical protein